MKNNVLLRCKIPGIKEQIATKSSPVLYYNPSISQDVLPNKVYMILL